MPIPGQKSVVNPATTYIVIYERLHNIPTQQMACVRSQATMALQNRERDANFHIQHKFLMAYVAFYKSNQSCEIKKVLSLH